VGLPQPPVYSRTNAARPRTPQKVMLSNCVSGATNCLSTKAGSSRDARGQGIMFSTVVNWYVLLQRDRGGWGLTLRFFVRVTAPDRRTLACPQGDCRQL
jgi:hypothetical protein